MQNFVLYKPRPARPNALKGFSLIELMVAIALGMVLIAGLAGLFANSSRASSEVNKSIRQIENGRFAIEILSEDLSMAGFYSDLSPSGITATDIAPADVCATALTAGVGLGWSNATLSVPVAITGLSATEAAALTCLTNYKANTPALVVRRMDPTAVVASAATNGTVYFQTSQCASDPLATQFVISRSSTDFVLRKQNCTTINTVRRYLTRIYYIATCSDCSDDSIPTLKRAELSGSAFVVSPVAEGIDDMGFEYAFDTDGNGMINGTDQYLAALNPPAPLGTGSAATNTWGNVVGVRVNLLSRTTEPSAGYTEPVNKIYSLGLAGNRGPFTDGNKRKAYIATARLNNVAGPREVQP